MVVSGETIWFDIPLQFRMALVHRQPRREFSHWSVLAESHLATESVTENSKFSFELYYLTYDKMACSALIGHRAQREMPEMNHYDDYYLRLGTSDHWNAYQNKNKNYEYVFYTLFCVF